MAERVSRRRRIYGRIVDWIWPHLIDVEDPEPKHRDYFDHNQTTKIDDIFTVLSFRLSQVEERSRNVDSKLIALLTLTSVLTAAIGASVAAAATLGSVQENDKIYTCIVVALIFYMTCQLIRALWCAVSGLKRRPYVRLSPEDMVPKACEEGGVYQVRMMNAQVNHMQWNEWVVSQKVSEMAVAHIAFRNALCGTYALVFATLISTVVKTGWSLSSRFQSR